MVDSIRTVGDLKRLLNVYDDKLPLAFQCNSMPLHLFTDMQISAKIFENRPVLLIDLLDVEVFDKSTLNYKEAR